MKNFEEIDGRSSSKEILENEKQISGDEDLSSFAIEENLTETEKEISVRLLDSFLDRFDSQTNEEMDKQYGLPLGTFDRIRNVIMDASIDIEDSKENNNNSYFRKIEQGEFIVEIDNRDKKIEIKNKEGGSILSFEEDEIVGSADGRTFNSMVIGDSIETVLSNNEAEDDIDSVREKIGATQEKFKAAEIGAINLANALKEKGFSEEETVSEKEEEITDEDSEDSVRINLETPLLELLEGIPEEIKDIESLIENSENLDLHDKIETLRMLRFKINQKYQILLDSFDAYEDEITEENYEEFEKSKKDLEDIYEKVDETVTALETGDIEGEEKEAKEGDVLEEKEMKKETIKKRLEAIQESNRESILKFSEILSKFDEEMASILEKVKDGNSTEEDEKRLRLLEDKKAVLTGNLMLTGTASLFEEQIFDNDKENKSLEILETVCAAEKAVKIMGIDLERKIMEISDDKKEAVKKIRKAEKKKSGNTGTGSEEKEDGDQKDEENENKNEKFLEKEDIYSVKNSKAKELYEDLENGSEDFQKIETIENILEIANFVNDIDAVRSIRKSKEMDPESEKFNLYIDSKTEDGENVRDSISIDFMRDEESLNKEFKKGFLSRFRSKGVDVKIIRVREILENGSTKEEDTDNSSDFSIEEKDPKEEDTLEMNGTKVTVVKGDRSEPKKVEKDEIKVESLSEKNDEIKREALLDELERKVPSMTREDIDSLLKRLYPENGIKTDFLDKESKGISIEDLDSVLSFYNDDTEVKSLLNSDFVILPSGDNIVRKIEGLTVGELKDIIKTSSEL